MKVLSAVLLAMLAASCNPDGPCQSLQLGQSSAGLPLSGAPKADPTTASYTLGPALQDYCCATLSSTVNACTATACTGDPGVSVSLLGAPYTYTYSPELSSAVQECVIETVDGGISSVWSATYEG